MSKTLKLIHDEPTVENTIPLEVFQNYSPEQFSLADEDNYIMYAGGKGFRLEIIDNNPNNDIKIAEELQRANFSHCSLFVLNSTFIIWFNDERFGIQIPYQCILLHALQKQDGLDVLYMQLASSGLISSTPKEQTDFSPNVDIVIRGHSYDHNKTNPLFDKFESNTREIFDALSKCSRFHYDSDSDLDGSDSFPETQATSTNNPSIEIPGNWIDGYTVPGDGDETHRVIVGDADDLDMTTSVSGMEDNSVAAMYVDIGYGPIAGTTRPLDDGSTTNKKSRRLV